MCAYTIFVSEYERTTEDQNCITEYFVSKDLSFSLKSFISK